MSKKPSMYAVQKTNDSNFLAQSQTKSDRVYTSTLDCIKKSDKTRGLRLALITQVPYQTLLLSSFSIVESMTTSKETYHRYDDYSFAYKFLTRFGSLTLSSTLAYSFCYPLDTVKRRMQAEGSPGYKFTDTNNEINYAKQMLKAEGVSGFYKGFVPGLIRTVPMCFMQFIVY